MRDDAKPRGHDRERVQRVEVLGLPELATDPRFDSFAARDQNRDQLLEILDQSFLARGTHDWLEALADAGVPGSAVNDVASLFADPQTRARGAVVEYTHPGLGTLRRAASPLRIGANPNPVRPAPTRGEHTRAVLNELCGYANDHIDNLAEAGAFGDSGKARGDP